MTYPNRKIIASFTHILTFYYRMFMLSKQFDKHLKKSFFMQNTFTKKDYNHITVIYGSNDSFTKYL